MSDTTVPPFAGGLTDSELLWDTGQLARYLGGSPDSFTGQLLNLVAKADPGNRRRLMSAFPREVVAWYIWRALPVNPTPGQMRSQLAAINAGLDGADLARPCQGCGKPRWRSSACLQPHVRVIGLTGV